MRGSEPWMVSILSCRPGFQIRISQLCQIGGPWAGDKFAEHGVFLWLCFFLRVPVVGRFEISKNNRVRGAGLLACSLNFAFLNTSISFFGGDARAADALDAIR